MTAAVAAVARRLREFRTVSMQMVLGLLTIYLLIGLFFAYVDLAVAVLLGGFFVSGPVRLSSHVYFSYVTLATVGYGDFTPAEGLPQALAVLEALIGQLYLVSVVALAVGRFGLERGAPREPVGRSCRCVLPWRCVERGSTPSRSEREGS